MISSILITQVASFSVILQSFSVNVCLFITLDWSTMKRFFQGFHAASNFEVRMQIGIKLLFVGTQYL